MSKFNTKTVTNVKTTNLASGEAYTQSPKLALASHIITSMVQDQFYRSAEQGIDDLKNLLGQVDPLFAAKAAVYARTKHNLRSISHVVAGELAHSVKGEEWTKDFFNSVIVRPDDMTEILSYYHANYGKKEPNALKKGFARRLTSFDDYQLAKYQGKNKGISLVDIVNLTHPKPTESIQKLVDGKLKNEKTFEAKLSKAGQNTNSTEEKQANKAAAWTELIETGQIGYMALIRNLRNIINDAPEAIDSAIKLITNEKKVKGSRLLPFQFVTAIEEVQKINSSKSREVIQALNTAVDIALANVPKFGGETLVAVDASGSMTGTWSYSGKGAIKAPIKNAALFASVLAKANNADVVLFDNNARYHAFNPSDSTLTIAAGIESKAMGGATNFHSVFETANKKYDRIIILSDMQAWKTGNYGSSIPSKSLADYKNKFDVNSHIYSFDLAGYGTLQFPENNVYALAGFSGEVFTVMEALEKDRNALIKEIEATQL